MAGSDVIHLGPFAGGLNNVLDPSSIQDNQLTTLVNYEVSSDGVLTNRPLITVNQWGESYGTGGNSKVDETNNGRAVVPVAVGRYKNDGAAVLYKFFGGRLWWERLNDAANSLGPLGNNVLSGVGEKDSTSLAQWAAVQYNNYMYFTNDRQPGWCGRLEIGTSNFLPIATMPMGGTILNHKGRLFIFPSPSTVSAENDNNSKFFYTDAPYTGGAWDQAKNFINVGFGDGQYITNALTYNGDILIFKENSTWRFSYEASISSGMIECINPSVGSHNHRSSTICNGVVYTFYEGEVHEIYNYQWSNVSENVRFDRGNIDSGETYVNPVSLFTLGDRVILSHYGKMYSYSQRSRAWSEWETEYPITNPVLIPDAVLDDDRGEMLLGAYYKNPRKPFDANHNWKFTRLYRMFDSYLPITDIGHKGGTSGGDQQDKESFECRIRTKSFDMGSDASFKRLMWWGASVLTTSNVQGQGTVVVNGAAFTYDQLDGTRYSDLDLATWDNLLDILPQVSTDVDAESQTSHGKRFIKFLKGLRFRQIYFTYKTTVDGTSKTIPNKVYSLTAVLRGKTKVTKEIS